MTHDEQKSPSKRAKKRAERISVMEVCAELGLEPSVRQAWSIGATVSRAFRRKTGSLPPKELRPKRDGSGSQAHATYPARWRKSIEREIRKCVEPDKRQQDLFDDQAPDGQSDLFGQ